MIGLNTALLFVAVGGIFLLFARDWTARIAGAFLIVPRALAAPLTDGEIIILGCGIVSALAHIVYGWTYAPAEQSEEPSEAPDPPDADDTSEPAACVSCRGLIPAGADTCPRCGWSYTAPDRNVM